MRTAVVGLALLAIGGLSRALADPPVTPATPESAAAPAPAPTPTSAAAPPLSTPAAAAQTSESTPEKTSDRQMAEKQLRTQGYRLSMVRGQEMYCRREAPIGSRLESTMHCVTIAEAELMAKEGQETTEHLQRNMPGCLNPAMGGCGK